MVCLFQTFQIHNIVIIQPPGGSLVVPTATYCSTIQPSIKTLDVKVPESSTQPQKDCSQAENSKDKLCGHSIMPENKQCAQTLASDQPSVQSTSNDKLDGNHSNHAEDLHMEHSPVCGDELGSMVPLQSERDASSEGLSVAQTHGNSKILGRISKTHLQSQTTDNESLEVPVSECDISVRTALAGSCKGEKQAETVTQVEEDDALNGERQLHDSHKDVNNETSVMNSQSSSIFKENNVNSEPVRELQKIHGKEKDESVGSENMPFLQCSPSQASLCDSTPPSTPEKVSPSTATFSSQDLYLCTPFTTPQKPEDQSSSPASLSTSPLCTPIFTAPSPTNSPEEALQGLRQRNLTAELETNEELHRAAGSLVKNMPYTKAQSVSEEITKGKASTPLTRVTQSPIASLVTSVYDSSVLSKEKEDRSLHLINITSSKPETRLRKISPAKTFKSPMKTSPLKQVSPILRKYHKYSPKKRNLRSGKLLPILPKFTVSKSKCMEIRMTS